jgi:hypothetical protein
VTQDLGFSGLVRRTAPFSRLLRHTMGCGGSILTRILTDDLYQVWLKLACCFWRRFFFNIKTCEYSFPYCGPSRPPGTLIWADFNLLYIMSESMYVNLSSSGSVFLEKIFKWPNPHFCDNLHFEEELAHYLYNLESPLPKHWLIDYLRFYVPLKIFHLYGDVTIAGGRLQNLDLYSVLRAFEQGGIFIVPNLL